MPCRREVLIEGDGHTVVRCSCGTYYLQIGEVAVRLTGERFVRLSRDLELVASGALGGRGLRGPRRPGDSN
jgi:hypothetical protein